MIFWSQVNDRAVQSLIGVIMLTAAILVVVGLVRALRGRERYQLVILDVDPADLEAAAVARLSEKLQQKVRKLFHSQGALDYPRSLKETVGKDIDAGIGGLHSRVKDISRLEAEVLSAPRDEIEMLAAGIGALTPDRAEGLVRALSGVFPVQHGSTIKTTVRTREWGGVRQVGLTLDAGPIHRGPQASATFWSIGAASGTGGSAPNYRDQLKYLLRPAALWIGIYLVAGTVPIRSVKRLSLARTFQSKDLRDEVDALRAIFAAQLAAYEMFWYSKDPLVALGFSPQALDDVERAMHVLKKYFRPHYLAGTIHEHRGNAQTALKDLVGGAPHGADSRLVNSYAGRAIKSYDKAHEEFEQALTLLDQPDRRTAGRAKELRLDIHVRSLKTALRGSDPGRALDQVLKEFDQVPNEEVTSTTPDQRYNVACLYAVASAVAEKYPDRDGGELARRFRKELVAVLDQAPALADTVESDADLLLAFTPEELHGLAHGARDAATATQTA